MVEKVQWLAVVVVFLLVGAWAWVRCSPPSVPPGVVTVTVTAVPPTPSVTAVSATFTPRPTMTTVPPTMTTTRILTKTPLPSPTVTMTAVPPMVTPTTEPSPTPCVVEVEVHHPIFDTLYISACRYLSSCNDWGQIQKDNGIKNPHHLRDGDVYKVMCDG